MRRTHFFHTLFRSRTVSCLTGRSLLRFVEGAKQKSQQNHTNDEHHTIQNKTPQAMQQYARSNKAPRQPICLRWRQRNFKSGVRPAPKCTHLATIRFSNIHIFHICVFLWNLAFMFPSFLFWRRLSRTHHNSLSGAPCVWQACAVIPHRKRTSTT